MVVHRQTQHGVEAGWIHQWDNPSPRRSATDVSNVVPNRDGTTGITSREVWGVGGHKYSTKGGFIPQTRQVHRGHPG